LLHNSFETVVCIFVKSIDKHKLFCYYKTVVNKNKTRKDQAMPEHLKDAPETEEFQHYLRSFRERQEKQHRRRVASEVLASLSLMIAG